ncbi:hypothetical protein SPI_04796 [Niveomyces insectorum RCEF 264]|uniref:Cyclase n=1 Tax=Niveomyces insectorum RCEF 264 TaxID=1081102 RepID=A0A167UV02_9HYPO|nr:hypothetical protein SPI_04796 [Niveomyces insectorum RCEF 264]
MSSIMCGAGPETRLAALLPERRTDRQGVVLSGPGRGPSEAARQRRTTRPATPFSLVVVAHPDRLPTNHASPAPAPLLGPPARPGRSRGNAWGLYRREDDDNHPGDVDDALGALNMLTPAVVAAAASAEIRTGVRVSLDWPLTKPSAPSFGRTGLQHTLHSRLRTTDPGTDQRVVNDDTLQFNTQCSSQWDGFRHYGYQQAKRFYNNTSQETIESSNTLGIDAWVAHGGIVGRGVLLDYAGYAARHGIALDHFASAGIPVDHIQAVVREQGVAFQPGDIVLLRIGFTAAYDALTPAQQAALPQRAVPGFLGLAPTRGMLQWLWETNCAAVASDAVGLEQVPIFGDHVRQRQPGGAAGGEGGGHWHGEPWEQEMQGGGLLHQWVLAGWGVPIGEMFDLEALRAQCVQQKRWTFFFASVPLRVPGGVASPPNAIAIF